MWLGLKKAEVIALGVLFIIAPTLVAGQSVPDLQAQIQALLRQVAALSPQPSNIPPQPGGPPTDDYGSGPVENSSGARCPHLYSTIQLGSRNQGERDIQVEELQLFLADYYDIERSELVTGYFGTVTRSLVIRFQKEQNLPAYGIVGQLTRARIAEVCSDKQPPTFSVSPSAGGIPLTVLFSYTLNSEQTCEGRLYTFDPGVKSEKEIIPIYKPEGTCHAYVQHTEYTYTSVGNYVAALHVQLPGDGGSRTIGTARINAVKDGPGESCQVHVDKQVYSLGDSIKLGWASGGVKVMRFVPDTSGKDTIKVPSGFFPASGEVSLEANVLGNPRIEMRGLTPAGNEIPCWVTIKIEEGMPPRPPSSADFKINGSDGVVRIRVGEKATFTWKAVNVSSCTLSYKGTSSGTSAQTTSGEQTYGPYSASSIGTYQWTYQCKKPDGGTVSDSVSFIVGPDDPPPTPSASADIKIDGQDTYARVAVGKTATFSWKSSGVSSCALSYNGAASGGPSPVATSGELVSSVYTQSHVGAYIFTLTCVKTSGGSVSDTVQLIVVPTGYEASASDPNQNLATSLAAFELSLIALLEMFSE